MPTFNETRYLEGEDSDFRLAFFMNAHDDLIYKVDIGCNLFYPDANTTKIDHTGFERFNVSVLINAN